MERVWATSPDRLFLLPAPGEPWRHRRLLRVQVLSFQVVVNFLCSVVNIYLKVILPPKRIFILFQWRKRLLSQILVIFITIEV